MPDRPPSHSPAPPARKSWPAQFLPLLQPFRGRLACALLAMVLDALLTALRPWPLKVVIDRVLMQRPTRILFVGHWHGGAELDPVIILTGACVATLLIALGTGLLTYYFTHTMGVVGQRFVFALRCRLFAHMQRLSLRFHNRQRIGDLTARITSDTGAIQDIVANGSILFVGNACLLAAMLALMLWLNWRFALTALSVAPILFWIVWRSTRAVRATARQARTSDGLLASMAQETLSSIRIVQGLSQESQQDERFQAQGQNSMQAGLEGIRHQAAVAPLIDLLAAVGLVLVMWNGTRGVLAGELSTGDMIVFFAYVTNLFAPMRALSRLSFMINKAAVGAERIADIMDTRREVADRKGARRVTRVRGAIEFRDVSFEFEPGRPVLSQISFAIAPGEKIAIIGATGAGKTTLVSMLPRLFDPSSGTVLIDGVDLRDYQLAALRDQVGIVLQDALLFSGTIRENIAFGRPDATDAEIAAAAATANADEFIRRMPGGYNSLVAERGGSLSGGQKQRIAIARAILRDAPILILDEHTTGLDSATERAVIDAVDRAAAGRTTLIIAHHLSALRHADRVIVLDKGRLVEQGTREALLQKSSD